MKKLFYFGLIASVFLAIPLPAACSENKQSFANLCKNYLKAASPFFYRNQRKNIAAVKPTCIEPLTLEEKTRQGIAQNKAQKIWNDLHWFSTKNCVGKALCKINPNRACPEIVLSNSGTNGDSGNYCQSGKIFLPKDWKDDEATLIHELVHAWQESSYFRHMHWAFLFFFQAPEKYRFYLEYQADEKMMKQLYKKRDYVSVFNKVEGQFVVPEQNHITASPYLNARLDSFFKLLQKNPKDKELPKILQATTNNIALFNEQDFIKNKIKRHMFEEGMSKKDLEHEVQKYMKEVNPQPMLSVEEFKNWKPKTRSQRYKEHFEKYGPKKSDLEEDFEVPIW